MRDLRAETEGRNARAIELWTEGIRRFRDAFNALQGIHLSNPELDRVRLALLAHALNTQYGGFVLATGGFATQALPLVRRGVEDWLAWWYLQVRPEDAARFHDLEETTPDWNEMVQALEQSPPDWPSNHHARLWRKSLNGLSHVDRLTIRAMWDAADPMALRTGPTFDGYLFDNVAAEFVSALPALLEAAEGMCRSLGVEPPDAVGTKAFAVRIDNWIAELGG
jgi:hypothetical protein